MGSTRDVRTGIVRAPQGNLQCFSYPTGPKRGPCVTRKGAVRRPYGHVRKLTQPELAKIPHGRRIWPYGARTGPLRSPHGLFTDCIRSLNPCGAHKLKMHALKFNGPRTRGQNSRVVPVSGSTIFVQNSPGTARTGPGSVMWLRHYLNTNAIHALYIYLVNDSLLSFIIFSCGSTDYYSIVSSAQHEAIMLLWRRHNSVQHSRRPWRLISFTSMNPASNSPMFSPAMFRLTSNSDKKWASFPSLLVHVSNLKSASIASTITCNNLPGHSFESPHEPIHHLTPMCWLLTSSHHSCRYKIRENVSLFHCGIFSVPNSIS